MVLFHNRFSTGKCHISLAVFIPSLRIHTYNYHMHYNSVHVADGKIPVPLCSTLYIHLVENSPSLELLESKYRKQRKVLRQEQIASHSTPRKRRLNHGMI